jgi:tRNA U54 and U55 pseudouridine synthase Pus10
MAKQKLFNPKQEFSQLYLCNDCLAAMVDCFSNGNSKVNNIIKAKIKHLSESHLKKSEISQVSCSVCKNKKASTCPHCFTEVIGDLL